MDAWIKYAGGQELWDEIAGEFGLKNFACGNTGVQMGGWFNKEIESADDLKGLKMRIPGLGGDVMSKLGASPVSLPGGQIYENLVSGAIDATEWVGPYNDFFMKFYEAAKYYYFPGMHEPGAQLAMGMNAEFWGKLSKTDQAIIQAACNEENARTMAETNANNGEYLNRLFKTTVFNFVNSMMMYMIHSVKQLKKCLKKRAITQRYLRKSTTALLRSVLNLVNGTLFLMCLTQSSVTAF